jgi:hypothetical protein
MQDTHAGRGGDGGRGDWWPLVQGPVGAVAVVVPNVLVEDVLQVSPVVDQEPFGAFTAGCAHPALGAGVGLHRRLHTMGTIGIGGCG